MSDSNAVEAAKCDYCGAPIGFYGCPRHGTDCYNEELHPDEAKHPK